MRKLLLGLNEAQLQAVTLGNHHALIVAGAGSGKTRVLTTRIAWLLENLQISAEQVMAVTFTNKAAREMIGRLQALLKVDIRFNHMWIGTFHGLANRFLRLHYHDAGLPQNFQIIDQSEQQSLIKRLIQRLNLNEDQYAARDLQGFINRCKEDGTRAAMVEVYDHFTQNKQAIYAVYEQECQRNGLVDFAELLLRSYELFCHNRRLQTHYSERFKHILVDEFQDTNRLQYDWIKCLTQAQSSVFAVGDDDQAIYRFRGADSGHMRLFQSEFKVEEVIRLEQNYRSTGTILKAANAVIKNNQERLGKSLWTDLGDGEAIAVLNAVDDVSEAEWIIEKIKQNHREFGTPLRAHAILYRSNAQSRLLEHHMVSAGLPYHIYGGQRFYDRQEIRDALAYLRLYANSHDNQAFLRIVNTPPRGIGMRSIEILNEAAQNETLSLWQAIDVLPERTQSKFKAFTGLLEHWRQDWADYTLTDVVDGLINHSGLIEFYQQQKNRGEDRIDNLHELKTAAETFEREYGKDKPLFDKLSAFLDHASLESGDQQADKMLDAIQLMTVHSAKGLEFDTVFVVGLEQGLFPHQRALDDGDFGLEEERRLFYVAITRARRALYLSWAERRNLFGRYLVNMASCLLTEIPSTLLKPVFDTNGAFSNRAFSSQTLTSKTEQYAKTTHQHGLRAGQSVRHKKFGQGVILAFEGSGEDARVQVNFSQGQSKWLLLSLAQLETLD